MASDFGMCFVMRVGARFGQELKCPRFTARSSVDGFGLKAQACRYFDKSCFFWLGGLCCLSVGVLMGR